MLLLKGSSWNSCRDPAEGCSLHCVVGSIRGKVRSGVEGSMGSTGSVGSSRSIAIYGVGSSIGSQVRGGVGGGVGSSRELFYRGRSLLGRKVVSGGNSLEEEVGWSSSSQKVIRWGSGR